MILGSIKNLFSYDFTTDGMLEFLDKGTFEVDEYLLSNGIKAIVQSCKTKPARDKRLEAHKDFYDVQCLIKGKEIMQYANITELEVDEEWNLQKHGGKGYNLKKDIIFYKDPEPKQIVEVKVNEGYFTFFSPEDGHKPGCQFDGEEDVLKIVFKIPIGAF